VNEVDCLLFEMVVLAVLFTFVFVFAVGFVVYLFLSMVVWQPFRGCWRHIIARVSEMHVAYHTRVQFRVTSSSEQNNSINSIRVTFLWTKKDWNKRS
jgi:hypothetical protein